MAAGTHDITVGGAVYSPECFSVSEAVLDFSAHTIGNGETVDVIDIPANTIVLGVVVDCKVAEGAALTIDVGSQSSASLWHNNYDCNQITTPAVSVTPYGFVTANAIQCLCNNASADTAVVVIKAIMVNMGDKQDDYTD